MKRFFDLFYCILRSKKIFSVKKKKFVIFDCVNSDIVSKILPNNQTFVVSARFNKINKLLINFRTVYFMMRNIFSRSMQLNYFIALINQIDPKFVITTIDNSITFSKLTKYFENKIKFIAIQNATRGDFYENPEAHNSLLYFTNYMGMSNFDHDLMKTKNIKVKNFFAIGSIRNSYFKYFIYPQKKHLKKRYDICLVSKHIFKEGSRVNVSYSKAIFKIVDFLSRYVKKYKKSIIIQSKATSKNFIEKEFYDEKFKDTNYEISWKDNDNYNSYQSISSSDLIIGAPSTLLRESSVYPNSKLICFNSEKKDKKNPFSLTNFILDMTFEEFEKKLNLTFENGKNDVSAKTNDSEYIMAKINSINYFLELLEKKEKSLI